MEADDALEAMHAAITAGYDSTPDPRCRLAEIQLRAGRTEPARELFAQVYAETPDDVWLHNNAEIEYAAVGDYPQALAWLTSGLQRGFRTAARPAPGRPPRRPARPRPAPR